MTCSPSIPTVKVHVDAGYRGLATAFPDQLYAPPRKPTKDAPAEQLVRYEQARKRQSSRRICVEHALAEHKQWRSLQRWIGPRGALQRGLPGGRRAGLRPSCPPLNTISRHRQTDTPRSQSRTKPLKVMLRERGHALGMRPSTPPARANSNPG